MPKRKHPTLTLRESKAKRLQRLKESAANKRSRREMETEHERSQRLQADSARARAKREAEEQE